MNPELLEAMIECRSAQKAYFKDRNTANLTRAKDAERAVDRLLLETRSPALLDVPATPVQSSGDKLLCQMAEQNLENYNDCDRAVLLDIIIGWVMSARHALRVKEVA